MNGEQLRDEAIARVERGATAEWKDAAYNAVVAVAKRLHEFTTDDVWAELEDQSESARERRAMGAIITKAARQLVIQKTDRVRESIRPVCHRNPKAVWRSLVFEHVLPADGGASGGLY